PGLQPRVMRSRGWRPLEQRGRVLTVNSETETLPSFATRSGERDKAGSDASAALRGAVVVHGMYVAGAEVLVGETLRRVGPKLTPVVCCLDAVGELGEQLRADGVDIVGFERKPGLDLSLVSRMAAEIQRRRVQVLHAHQYTPFFYAALARLRTRP